MPRLNFLQDVSQVAGIAGARRAAVGALIVERQAEWFSRRLRQTHITFESAGSRGVFTGRGTIDGNHQLAISWASVPGANYNVYSTTSLTPPILWTPVNSTPIFAAGTTTSYTLPGSIAGQPQLFVRVAQ